MFLWQLRLEYLVHGLSQMKILHEMGIREETSNCQGTAGTRLVRARAGLSSQASAVRAVLWGKASHGALVCEAMSIPSRSYPGGLGDR